VKVIAVRTVPTWQKTTNQTRAVVSPIAGRSRPEKQRPMKRIGNLYQQICSLDNLALADVKARKGKGQQLHIMRHDADRKANLERLHHALISREYRTSEYHIFKIYEPKEREVYRLPYYPDRITHHAIMNVLEQVFMGTFTADTYSCIKGRGIHGAARAVTRALTHRQETQYCLKLDITKFYPSVDHDVLKAQLRRKIKDKNLLWLMDEIINSATGLPIGNYLSQYLANYYLTGFDHWLKEVKGVKYYFRYADDIVILGADKPVLHYLLAEIKRYLRENLKLEVKGNYQVFPVAARGIDFVGYRFYHTHILLRKSIKRACARKLKKKRNPATIASYMGWMSHCNSNNLQKKLFGEKFQATRHNGRKQGVCGGEDQGRQNTEPRDSGAGL
jgi:RNA-directed DNA polymerase